MQGVKTQTQIKFSVGRPGGGGGGGGGGGRSAPASYSGGGGGAGGSKNTFELKNLFSGGKGGGEPIVDDMKYRKPSRLIALIDIAYSSFLLVAQLLHLITGAAHESTKVNGEVEGESSGVREDDNGESEPGVVEEATMFLSPKTRATISVLVWIGMFTVLILQLVVAGALYGGTFERDGRKCMRNCKIWFCTTVFLVGVLVLQILAIFIFGHFTNHLLLLGLESGEVGFRTVGLVFIAKFIKELSFEFDDNDNSSCGDRGGGGCPGGSGGGSISPRDLNRIQYEPLLCSSPSLQSGKTIRTTNDPVHHV